VLLLLLRRRRHAGCAGRVAALLRRCRVPALLALVQRKPFGWWQGYEHGTCV
jgi:hypothetical protein